MPDSKQPHYQADEEPARIAPAPPPPRAAEPDAADNRGARADVTAAGEVIGSGASAGGKGNGEDIDSDAAGGDGQHVTPHSERPRTGADAPKHNSA
ncbi:MAG: hypothetical protein PGN09_12235 [Sphingomonas fennica]